MEASPDPFDELGLLGPRRQIFVRFGDVEVGPASKNARFTTGLNQAPTASFTLDLAYAPAGPLDLQSVVELGTREGEEHLLFSGNVVSARPADQRVEIEASGAVWLQESLVGGFVSSRMPAPEIIHAMARSAGMAETQLNIEGLEGLPLEVFEVLAPVEGVRVSRATRMGQITFLPRDQAKNGLGGLGPPEEMAEDFLDADCHALALVTATRVLDAEEIGLAGIDLVLSWLATRARYGLAWLPDGQPQAYERLARRSDPLRNDTVSVRGLRTRRHWLRTVDVHLPERNLDLEADPLLLKPALAPRLTVQEQQALLAIRRAATSTDPVAKVTAFSEALEFYVGGLEFKEVATKAERKVLRKAVPDELPDDVQRRAKKALDNINLRPLLERLRLVSEAEGVALSEGEWQLIEKIRRARNASVHGAGARPPHPEELDLGVSLLARLLVFRVARRTRRKNFSELG